MVSCRLIQSSIHIPLFRLKEKELLRGGEDILSLERVSWASGAENLPVFTHPFRVVDSVDPVLDLHDNAAVLGDQSTASLSALSRLDGNGTCNVVNSYQSIPKDLTYHLGRGSCTSGKPLGRSRCRA